MSLASRALLLGRGAAGGLGLLGRAGAGECLAYPLAEGALEAAAERLGRVSRETA